MLLAVSLHFVLFVRVHARRSFGGCPHAILPQSDESEYRSAKLENGVEYLLSRNTEGGFQEAAFGLLVPKGSLDDPTEILGLAHLAEHGLVRGSGRFPSAGDFDKFLAEHGGQFNAYTDAERSVFYFSIPGVKKDVWNDALDMFASFLETPLLIGWEQDIDTIDDEFAAQRSDPSRRLWDLLREVAFGPDESAGRFWTGNAQTFRRYGRDVVETHLRQHYSRLFCAPHVRLVLVGPFSDLSSMEVLLEDNFKALPRCVDGTPVPRLTGFSAESSVWKTHSNLGTFVTAQVRATSELWAWLPLPAIWLQSTSQPSLFIKYLLRDQGAGGLVSTLVRSERLVSSMMLGVDSFRARAWLYVRMGLTPKGFEMPQHVIMILESYIKRLGSLDITELQKLYRSFSAARALSFDFPARQASGAGAAVMLMEAWADSASVCDVLAVGGGLVAQPNVSFISELLQVMAHNLWENANVLLSSSETCKGTCKVQAQYGTPFKTMNSPLLTQEQRLHSPSVPTPAKCVGQRLPVPLEPFDMPQQLESKDWPHCLHVWWRIGFPGSLAESPRFSVRARIVGRRPEEIVEEAAALILIEAVREEIKGQVLPNLGGELCGLGASVTRQPVGAFEVVAEGLDVSLLSDLLAQIAAALARPLKSHSPELLHAWHRRAYSRLANRADDQAFDVASEATAELVLISGWTREDLLQAFRQKSATAIVSSTEDTVDFQAATIYLIAPGLVEKHVRAAASGFGKRLGLISTVGGDAKQMRSPHSRYSPQLQQVASISGSEVSIENPIPDDASSAVVISHFIEVTSLEEEITMTFLSHILDDWLSRHLRYSAKDTSAVVGYIVACTFRRRAPGAVEIRLTAQGTKPPTELRSLLFSALADFPVEFNRLLEATSSAELHKRADSMSSALLTPPVSLGDAADRDWGEIWTLQQCFGRRNQAARFLRNGVASGTLVAVLRRTWAKVTDGHSAIAQVIGSGRGQEAQFPLLVGPLQRTVLEKLWKDSPAIPVMSPCADTVTLAGSQSLAGLENAPLDEKGHKNPVEGRLEV